MAKQAAHINGAPSLPSTLYTEEYFLTACEGYDVVIESEGAHLSRRLGKAEMPTPRGYARFWRA